MRASDALFLTVPQALEAIARDFRQYPPQTVLFLNLAPLVTAGDMMVSRDDRRSGLWLQERGRRRRLLKPAQLGRLLVERLAVAPPNLETLAAVCAAVFGTEARAGRRDNREGVWVDTGMRRFTCRQCGDCCRSLDYHDGLTVKDVRYWQRLGRADILDWVRIYRQADRPTAYRIWVPPGSNRPAATCPWLEEKGGQGLFTCRIHAVKPGICRQYPGSRKHARLTGCPGFG